MAKTPKKDSSPKQLEATMLIYRRLTGADFHHIYKKKNKKQKQPTKKGGGQSYIDVNIEAVPLKAWKKFFSGERPEMRREGPRWRVPIRNIHVQHLDESKPQVVEIAQRSQASKPRNVSIRSQKLSSKEKDQTHPPHVGSSTRGNRLHAWNPRLGNFPEPSKEIKSAEDSQAKKLTKNLVVYLLRTSDSKFWAGWHNSPQPESGWHVCGQLNDLFVEENKDGYLEFDPPTPIDPSKFWPFIEPLADKGGKRLPDAGDATATTVASRGTVQFKQTSEDDETDSFFEADWVSGASAGSKKKIVVVNDRNKRAVAALKKLYKKCQITGTDFVFDKKDGKPYLEVHHLVPLGQGGADHPRNLIVVSAHMHRMLHHADVGNIDLAKISKNKLEIVINNETYTIKWKPGHAKLISED